MSEQHQIKITVSKKMEDILDRRAKEFGINKSKYCFNIIFEQIRKDLDD